MGLEFIKQLIENAQNQGASTEHILFRIQKCGIEPSLFQALDLGIIQPELLGWSEEVYSQKRMKFKFEQMARVGLWRSTAAQILSSLDMPCIFLKGVPLGIKLTGSPLWRNTNDVDIWVAPDQKDKAVEQLQKRGYTIAVEPHLWATNQILMEHPTLAPVEVHWQLAPVPWPSPSFEHAYKRIAYIHLEPIAIPVLSDRDLWLHLILHAHQHYFALKTFVDCMLALETIKPDVAFIKQYGLLQLHNTITTMIHAYTQPATPSAKDSIIMAATNLWFDNILSKYRGELIFGDQSKTMAGVGVLLRAASMGLLDGRCQATKAMAQVIFLGPHKIGQFFHHWSHKDKIN